MIRVAVGVLRDSSGQVLIAQRPADSHLAGLWEFPGGKRERGEGRWDALARELREEVGISVCDGHPLIRIVHRYPERTVELDVWEVTRWNGDPYEREGQSVEWVAVSELKRRELPPADLPIIRAIELPSAYLITPEPDWAYLEDFLAAFQRALHGGIKLVQLRTKAPLAVAADRKRFEHFAATVASLANASGVTVLLNAAGCDAPASFISDVADLFDGVHLSSLELAMANERPRRRWVGASCHCVEELARAETLGVDFAVLGPVKPTASHPDGRPLGWAGFEALTQSANLPIFGLGGLTRSDLADARHHGAQGIAAIRGLWPPC